MLTPVVLTRFAATNSCGTLEGCECGDYRTFCCHRRLRHLRKLRTRRLSHLSLPSTPAAPPKAANQPIRRRTRTGFCTLVCRFGDPAPQRLGLEVMRPLGLSDYPLTLDQGYPPIGLEDELTQERTVHSLKADAPADLYYLARRYTFLAFLVDTEYGSATYIEVERPARFEVRVSTTGLLIRETQ